MLIAACSWEIPDNCEIMEREVIAEVEEEGEHSRMDEGRHSRIEEDDHSRIEEGDHSRIEDENNELGKSTSNLLEVLHGGRPKDEEPHVKKSVKRKKEQVDYIVRVDLDALGISEDEFEDLQSLFQLFDHDKDGILNIKETQKLLRCLGFRANEEQAKSMASLVSVDTVGFSVSFNEYLRLVSIQRRAEPNEDSLLDVFQSFDPGNTGKIGEGQFRKIMKSKEAIQEEEVEEMVQEYRKLVIDKESADDADDVIYYKEFISMLQQ